MEITLTFLPPVARRDLQPMPSSLPPQLYVLIDMKYQAACTQHLKEYFIVCRKWPKLCCIKNLMYVM